MLKIILVFCTVGLFGVCLGQFIQDGQCDPNIATVQNFQVQQFLGVWHEISSYYSESATGSCPRAEYSLGDGVVNIVNSQVVNQALDTITGSATVISTDGSARLRVLLNVAPGVVAEQELLVLATDYINYAVTYSCTNLPNNQRRIYSWIVSRERTLSAQSSALVDQVINANIELNQQYYELARQTDADCFYFPEAVLNEPVVFRGQCDLNIPVVQNFDAARYLGLWHDIESYPTPFQSGTCSNALYSLGDGVVDVFNTQVINQRLDTINGVARVVSTDGSAKLSVSFPIAGTDLTTETDYWVLATDYISYSLVYSCRNLDSDSRQVTVWKLSRTKALTAAANTAINAVINTIDVTDQRYFQVTDQTPEGCFYFPEAQPGVPVVFPGQCDTTVPVVQNFNLNQFQGIWHEIEAYPKEDQPGQCINHQFSVGTGNTLALTSSNVFDQFLSTTTGTVSFASTDNSARLTITITSGGQTITIPYWILTTDYNSYALAYSCVNIGTDFRGVWSWKLSRTQQLTAAANTAINAVINTNVVLDNVYFETIDQSDQACFHLPNLGPEDPVVLPGQCDPNINVVQNFNVANFLGVWHEISSYYSESATGSCPRAQYSLGDGVVNIVNSQVVNQALDTITGSAAVISTDGSARLRVLLNVAPGVQAEQELLVLATDYINYAVTYSCTNLPNNQRRIYSWIVSRQRTLSAQSSPLVDQVINANIELNQQYFQPARQTDADCFYFPEAVLNQPVVFRGQCDLNIPVVQNFDAARYLGLWHDIEAYPTPFQSGTCSNALYSLGDGVVDVFNTQVINQRLDTINGVARVVSTDGSAKLSVSFPIAGTDLTTETDYWVLATDYDSYSLVYSCRNLDSDSRQVTVWKLSRTKALTAAANTAINAVINTIDVTDQRYFQVTDQTPEGCFYFPEAQPGVPVVFPGQCDTTIPVMQNFNLNQFQGIWHEIEAYPKEEQPGQCINHQFSVGTGNTLALTSSNVFDQLLSTTTGTVSFASTDNSARLTITITSGGQTITIPYWILTTDYNSYALAYSCVNIGTDFRGVWSWKLSRTQQLTAAANTAINAVINTNVVLDNVYFETIDQSDRACFYLPDLAPGEPVVLPGQCDSNINVVQNFNAVRYLGRWRLIESYPSDNEQGECNEATYSLGADGSVVVFNTQVVNQALDEITGSAVLATTDGSGKLLVTFPGIPTPFEYWILDTDYDNYALVYGCVNVNAQQRRVWSWKMSRDNTLSQSSTNAINQIVDSIDVLNNRFYQTVDRSDAACFYFPTPSAEPIVFRGQCDQNIPVVQNFNAVAYMGLWHEIERYPSRFQTGTCSNALYTLSGSTVEVFNTQVINQRLDTIDGTAVLASTDGSAKLTVSFPIAGTTQTTETDYWVLATDYNTYSLVYSCRNLNSEQREVSSWKLSRTKQLTAPGNLIINNVINTINVLDDRYFSTTDQSADGCFYFPEPQPGVPVVFPGQCDANVPVVQNFDLNQFQGIWNEIEAYPKEDQSGECINHQFTVATGNTLSLISSNVNETTLFTNTGTVSFTSTDGSARLSITINVDGQVITIPYWIISTDYTNYALAYSCVNINSDFRGVWSWKLSRTRQLSAASVTAINTAIATIVVLDNQYFEPIDQSDAACFHLPELGPNDPVILPGQCDPNIAVVQNFNTARYLGRWRLIESYQSDNQGGQCNEAQYSLGADGSVVVFNTQVVNQALDGITGSAVLATTDGSAKLLVTFPQTPTPFELWILDTDYESYSLAYGCVNINANQRRVWSWKLSRENTLSQAASIAINQVVDRINVLDDRYYQTVDRSDAACFYYPEATGDPVVFRGQCDATIPVVQNFDAVRYMGLWHEIERYPTPFQTGTCANALYTLTGGSVDVFNTEVTNQRLETINGVAVLATTDGSAKLIVTFPIAGTPLTVDTDYWVLDTDYTSYALVYSCRNLDSETRQVTSWKLSRTKQLTAAAATSINNVINTVNVLDQRYFNPTDQSDVGCFYFPEPQPGVQVEFPGQCDNNVPVVSNFDLAQFQGIWHEIEAYPKDDQPGECINHAFTTGTGNTLNLVSSNVLSQTLGVTTGVVSFASTDLSARLTITINVGGTNIQIPYWIVTTDYNNYALAYSCVNINTDFRRVFSWKLSRTRQLTATSNTAINTAMAAVDVIDNRYFETVDQTDEACFYLPDVAPGEPVVFNGQCDTSIPVMQNFDPSRYTGRWKVIESYPFDFQGSCGDSNYTLNNDNTITIVNTRVTSQTLDTLSGTAILASDGSARLLVSYPGAGNPTEYWILDTDYVSYALVYSCANQGTDRRRVWSWKLSREDTLPQTAITAINTIVDRIDVLNARYYQTVDRSDTACFYFPTPGADSVIFRGQCDQNIPVVTNFDAARYLGLWYNTESYPTPFQRGTCNSAYYSLNADGSVNVYNTEVVNQQLDTITGRAVVSSNDGSARLTVTFNINGVDVNSELWVLATDYTSYSLAYSCVNIDSERRQVYSWKLSRQPTLTDAANTAINTVINSILVLRQDYFIDRQHNEAGCFFYPDNNGGDVILEGQCVPDGQVQAVTNFNLNAFSGTWHEVARFPWDNQDGECAATQYTAQTQNSFSVIQTIVRNERQFETSIPSASVSNDGRGVISATVAGVPFNSVFVLATDYSEYALLYACRNLDTATKQIYSWKLSRSRDGLSTAANDTINTIVSDNIDLFEGYYSYTDQSNDGCFHYPEFDQPTTIDLPGPCDERITGVPNFNTNAFTGRWLELARYPQLTQQGQCNRVDSRLDGNVIQVTSSQVIDERLASISGNGVVFSTDGTGLLNVTINRPTGIETEVYYILATDYINFALAYSCRNLDNGNRRVTSWKLSRTTTLSALANSLINAAIANTQGLLEDYYQTTSQTEESCFYIPTLNPTSAPVFRGQCETITGVQNFDIQNYLGWWHEIERYPVDGSPGECISSTYSSSGNQYQVVDTSVTGLTADVVTGTVTATTDGRLRRTLASGEVEDIWVLATDYNNYALLYSCVNVDSEHRRVWSAKHSKARSLTTASQNAIAPLINANRVLYPELYLPVDQSDEACFHYPELSGQQVILPGQCDTAIPAVQNFDANAYTGTWYQIERYPQIHESGSCTGARYILDPDTGVVDVLNWEVVDGVLETISGTAVVVSTDGSARLSVTLPIRGTEDGTVTTPLYVLTTDYQSYSLAYSCVNVNEFQRAVGAWKLSRTRSMPDAGNTAINAYIAERQELHQPFFIRVEQSDDCEEPSSAFLAKSSIIVLLICAVLQLVA